MRIETSARYWKDVTDNIINCETNTLQEMLTTLEEFRNEQAIKQPFEDEHHTIRETRCIIRRELIKRWEVDKQFDFRDCPHFDMG